ncbi:DEAD/DEAH box helicase [Bacillus sp. FJAT-45350]|uniref:DEAD/DEAH box helicase n=1 Tax=Bacillus sp. FJAT-45350 TaxID=2011014 RepID=UPI000BB67E5A|nr:DEAD/DEAH box helicase [Bacillus sp. FJAT-45350]
MMNSNFERFELKPFLIDSMLEQGFDMPTEIQERLIPAIKNGKDVIGQSQTGSGKTLAFLLPLLDRIDPAISEVQAVITAPTRELASQILSVLKSLLEKEDSIQAMLIVGGTDRVRTIEKLKNQQPHIVVGTPGRIADMMDEQALKIYTGSTLVVDEADQMLDMGFIAEVDKVASRMSEDLQMLVFSATIPENLQPFLKKYMNNPRHVHVEPKNATAKKIDHQLLPLRHRDKIQVVIEAAKLLNPYLAIVFTNTKEHADEVADAMAAAGMNVERLHGGLNPRHRKQVMKQLQEAKIQYLVATDLAARGIDIKGISHIVNVDIPKDLDYYIHRVGRTARAGEEGIALTIFEPSDQQAVDKLIKRGISFSYVDVKKGEWAQLEKPRTRPTTSTTIVTKRKETKNTGGKAVAKAKNVKPGYKKKAKFKQAKEDQKQRRITSRTKKKK